jgi:hypothetical protein
MASRLVRALIGTVGLLVGCSDPGGVNELVRIEAHVLTPIVEAGDSVAVRVVAINPTSRDITVTSPNSAHFYAFMFDTNGNQVGRAGHGPLPSFTDLIIPARDSVVDTLHWSASTWSNDTWVPLPAGVYLVRGAVAGVPHLSAPSSLTVR